MRKGKFGSVEQQHDISRLPQWVRDYIAQLKAERDSAINDRVRDEETKR